MKKNVASQKIGAQMVSATDGSAFTGSVTVAVTGDAGTQATGSVGAGACTHEGGGYHTYAPAQAETNYDLVAFTFTGTGAVPATIQVFTAFPQTGDNFARIGAPAGASISADIAAVKADTAAVKTKTDFLPSATAGAAGGVFIAGTNAATSITTALTANITGNLSGSVGSVTGAVGSVTGAVGSVTGAVGSVTGAVGSVASGGIASTSFAADAITAAALATDAVTEIQSGLATAAALATVDGIVDDILVDTAVIGAAGAGLTALASQASVDTIDGIVDSILDDTGTSGVAISTTGIAAIWAYVVEGSYTAVQYMRGMASVLFGKSSGLAGTAPTFRDTGDTKARVTGTVDASGNRSAVTLDLT